MIVQCEECHSKFNLDESLLKEGGSKVRCSLCRSVFLAYPQKDASLEEEVLRPEQDGPEETVILDSPPDLDEMPAETVTREPALSAGAGPDEPSEEPGDGFDMAFDEDSVEEFEDSGDLEKIEAFSPEDVSDLDDAPADMEEAFERASRIEEEITRKDAEKKEQGAEAAEESDFSPAPAARRGSRSILLFLLLGLLLLVGAGYAALHFLPPGLIHEVIPLMKPRAERTPVDAGVRRLSFEGVKGSFVLTEEGKQRFVIKGDIVNNYSEPRSFISVKASILDGQGRSVRSQTVYAGNSFTQGELVGRPIEFLEERLNRRGGEEGRNVAVPTGDKVPFMVVFQDLPEDISEFTVEGVSSSPGGGN